MRGEVGGGVLGSRSAGGEGGGGGGGERGQSRMSDSCATTPLHRRRAAITQT